MHRILSQPWGLIAPTAIVAVSLTLSACGGGGAQQLPTQPPVGTKAAAGAPPAGGSPAAPASPAPAAPQPAASPGAPAPAAPAKTIGDAAAGQQAIGKYGCGGCHTIPGIQGAAGTVGPNLGGIAKRPTIAGTVPNNPDNLVKWIMNPPSMKPGTAMPVLGVNQADAQNIAAFLETLQ